MCGNGVWKYIKKKKRASWTAWKDSQIHFIQEMKNKNRGKINCNYVTIPENTKITFYSTLNNIHSEMKDKSKVYKGSTHVKGTGSGNSILLLSS